VVVFDSQGQARRVVVGLWAGVGLLTAASLIGQYSTYFLGDGHLYTFVPQFNLDREMNVPTWFSSFLFLFSALLLHSVYRRENSAGRPFVSRWRLLAGVFVFLSVDEISAIHETLVESLRGAFHAGGYLYFAWVIPGAGFVVLLAVILWGWFRSLPKAVRVAFGLAAAVFLAGALGLEMVGGNYVLLHGRDHFEYALLANLEEALEMSGLVLFIMGLLKMLGPVAPPPSVQTE